MHLCVTIPIKRKKKMFLLQELIILFIILEELIEEMIYLFSSLRELTIILKLATGSVCYVKYCWVNVSNRDPSMG